MSTVASLHSLAPPTVHDLVTRARELAPLLRKNAAASEANRRVEEETIQAMRKAGLMRVWRRRMGCKPQQCLLLADKPVSGPRPRRSVRQ